MPRIPVINRLKNAQEVRESIADLRSRGRTLDEIVAELEEEFGVTIARSTLHSHVKGVERAIAINNRTQVITEAMIRAQGHDMESKVARTGMALLQSVLLDMVLAEDEERENGEIVPGGIQTPKQAVDMARAMSYLQKARRDDAELMAKLRAEQREAARKEVTEAVSAVAGAGAMTDETLGAIMTHLDALQKTEGGEV